MKRESTARMVITGRPGVGKSTLFRAIVDALRGMGCSVGGIAAPEVREGGRRVGFLLVDLATGDRAWLARAGGGCSGPRIGRYIVCAAEASRLGVAAIEKAISNSDIIGIDEVGPMELALPALRRAILKAASSPKPLLAVAHARLRSRDPEAYAALTRGAEIVEVTIENRGILQARAGEYAVRLALSAGCGPRAL